MFITHRNSFACAALAGLVWLTATTVQASQSEAVCTGYDECKKKGIDSLDKGNRMQHPGDDLVPEQEGHYKNAILAFATARTLSDDKIIIAELNGYIGLGWKGLKKYDEAASYLQAAINVHRNGARLKIFKDAMAEITADSLPEQKIENESEIGKMIALDTDIEVLVSEGNAGSTRQENTQSRPIVRGFINGSPQALIVVAQAGIEDSTGDQVKTSQTTPRPPRVSPEPPKCYMVNIGIPLEFEYKSAVLDESGLAQATNIGKALVAMLRQDDSVAFTITGHTDMYGGNPYNLGLSKQRALALKQYLSINFPELHERITTVNGAGKSNLLVTDDDMEKQKKNRRVEVRVKHCQHPPKQTASGVS